MIIVKDLTKKYTSKNIEHHVLNGISFSVKRGEVFGIIGKSGAGKSTLIKCLNLLEKPSSGEVIIDGVSLTNVSMPELRKIRQQIGVIFQGFNLLNAKTVFENVALPLKLQAKLSKPQIKQKVDELLELVGLTELAHEYPGRLSGGQKQRVGIARALSTSPKVLLSDEATSALDSQTTNSILELLLDINEKLGITIILITHEIEVVRKICDKVAVIDGGKIIEVGNTVDVILHPVEDLTRKLILEEETDKYLEQIMDFYKFHKTKNTHLLVISFIGEHTFNPILSEVSLASGVVFSILRGELGRIKKMPFGQLLLEMNGEVSELEQAFLLLDGYSVHYEVIT
ncbi:MAG: ATP-binding cassette domain-containing protein [Proteobacteria bacterium]|jgi:D-methionine transport system ATP-binding protein|nr:ATP-binding cassette domain-containing protein [Pseudomonadota bacterium]